jgi:hypothetical protein
LFCSAVKSRSQQIWTSGRVWPVPRGIAYPAQVQEAAVRLLFGWLATLTAMEWATSSLPQARPHMWFMAKTRRKLSNPTRCLSCTSSAYLTNPHIVTHPRKTRLPNSSSFSRICLPVCRAGSLLLCRPRSRRDRPRDSRAHNHWSCSQLWGVRSALRHCTTVPKLSQRAAQRPAITPTIYLHRHTRKICHTASGCRSLPVMVPPSCSASTGPLTPLALWPTTLLPPFRAVWV